MNSAEPILCVATPSEGWWDLERWAGYSNGWHDPGLSSTRVPTGPPSTAEKVWNLGHVPARWCPVVPRVPWPGSLPRHWATWAPEWEVEGCVPQGSALLENIPLLHFTHMWFSKEQRHDWATFTFTFNDPYMMIFYFYLVYFTFSISYSVLLFHLVYNFQFLHLFRYSLPSLHQA